MLQQQCSLADTRNSPDLKMHIGVEDLGLEAHTRSHQGVLLGNFQNNFKNATLKWCVFGPLKSVNVLISGQE